MNYKVPRTRFPFHERPSASAAGRAASETIAFRHGESEAEAVSSWLLRRQTGGLS
jgi:hypothetical protein